MPEVLVDTSTLIGLALAAATKGIPAGDTNSLWRHHVDIDGGIDALVLSEKVLFDKPSIDRNTEDLPTLGQFTTMGRLVGDHAESEVYAAVGKNYLHHIEGTPAALDLFRMHTTPEIAAEVGARVYFPSASWEDVASELQDDGAKDLAVALHARFASHGPRWGAACALLLRTLYYDELQRSYGVDLVLHPLKAAYRETPRSSESSVLNIFDKTVREAFYRRKKDWLGRDEVTVDIPLLTQFVLGKCRSWADLPGVIADIRTSEVAAKFREGVSELGDALRQRQNETVDAVLAELSARQAEWSKQLGSGRLTKKLSLSVPFIGVHADFNVPDRKLKQSPADKILGFVQLLLQSS